MREVIAITGATGMIGKLLCKNLVEAGHEVRSISRSSKQHPVAGVKTYTWSVQESYLDPASLQNATVLIHLAGESIAGGKWTEAYRRLIWDSRVQTAALLNKSLVEHGGSVHTVIGTSGIGYYARKKSQIDESGPAGDDFPAQVCVAWEKAEESLAINRRLVIFRIGIVLSRDGGAFPKLVAPVRNFIGTWLGDGHQVLSWIHVRDVAGLFAHAVETSSMSGIYNAVAQEPCSQKFFLQQVGRYLHRPVWSIGAPPTLLKFFLGEMSQLVLTGNTVISTRLSQTGYKFKYPYLYDALQQLCKGR